MTIDSPLVVDSVVMNYVRLKLHPPPRGTRYSKVEWSNRNPFLLSTQKAKRNR